MLKLRSSIIPNMSEFRSYFAYASNMIEAQIRVRAPSARLVGPARLNDFGFTIAVCGYASIVRRPDSAVYGLLWEITPDCERALDRAEGVHRGVYTKEIVKVTTADGDREALVYIAADPSRGRNCYRDRWHQIVDSARRHGFPPTYVAELQSFT